MAAEEREIARFWVDGFMTYGDNYQQNPKSRQQMEIYVTVCYVRSAQSAHVRHNELKREHFEETIRVFVAELAELSTAMSEEEARQKRNRILGAILAEDILRARLSQPNNFLQGEAWLSKHLIAALINPKDENFRTDMIEIFKAALCDRTVIDKYNQLFGYTPALRDQVFTPIMRQLNVTLYLGRIFPSLDSSDKMDRVEEMEESALNPSQPCSDNRAMSAIADEVVAHIDEQIIDEQIAEEAPTASSSMCANFLLSCCPEGETVFTIGGLLFLFGFTLMLSTVVTAVPSCFTTVLPSLGVGGAAMVIGAGMMLGALGFFGSFKCSDSDDTRKERSGLYPPTVFHSSISS